MSKTALSNASPFSTLSSADLIGRMLGSLVVQCQPSDCNLWALGCASQPARTIAPKTQRSVRSRMANGLKFVAFEIGFMTEPFLKAAHHLFTLYRRIGARRHL